MGKLNWTSGLTTLSKNSKISLTDTTVLLSDVAENGEKSKNLTPLFLLIVFVVIALVFSSRVEKSSKSSSDNGGSDNGSSNKGVSNGNKGSSKKGSFNSQKRQFRTRKR